jgi:hypothetical protein
MMSKAEERIRRLEEQKAKVLAELQAAKARFARKERAEDTRRKILAGGMILDQVAAGDWPREKLLAALDEYLDRSSDRALFGLAPNPEQTAQPAEQ